MILKAASQVRESQMFVIFPFQHFPRVSTSSQWDLTLLNVKGKKTGLVEIIMGRMFSLMKITNAANQRKILIPCIVN